MDFGYVVIIIGCIVAICYRVSKIAADKNKALSDAGIKFKNIKYISGLAEIDQATRVHLTATKEGIELMNSMTIQRICVLPWDKIVKIDALKQSDNTVVNVRQTGSSMGASIGQGLGAAAASAMLDKHNLTIHLKRHANDDFLQDVVFDDLQHEKIRTYLMQSRASFFPEGINKSAVQNISTDNNDPTKQLEKLADLKNKGVITEAEFNEKKKLLLDKI